jgi:TATA-binding protein-associated factor Taf7
MEDTPRPHLSLIQGERAGPRRPRLRREALRVIPGGEAGDLQAAIEETVLAARQMRREIEERIARALDELF